MFNEDLKKAAVAEMRSVSYKMEQTSKQIVVLSERLFSSKNEGKKLVDDSVRFINTIAHTPKEITTVVEKINVQKKSYEDDLEEIEVKLKEVEDIKATKEATAAFGVGVAALGPSAMMAVATTFGTAGTGAAISGLSGAAATNAALAWIGGGTLAAGGGGMAAGKAFIAMTGPVGVAIALGAFALGGFLQSCSNEEAAKKASQNTQIYLQVYKDCLVSKAKIKQQRQTIQELTHKLRYAFNQLISKQIFDYRALDRETRQELQVFVNTVYSLAAKINEKVN